MHLHGVAVGAGEYRRIGDGNTPVGADRFDDAERELRQVREHDLFVFDLFLEALHLGSQGTQEEDHPGLPVRRIASDGSLGLSQGQVVPLLVLLDDAFERTVWYVGVAGLQEEEHREHAREPPVSILEWVNLQEGHRKDGDTQERMERSFFPSLAVPRQKVGHESWRIEWGGRGKDDPDLLTIRCER